MNIFFQNHKIKKKRLVFIKKIIRLYRKNLN